MKCNVSPRGLILSASAVFAALACLTGGSANVSAHDDRCVAGKNVRFVENTYLRVRGKRVCRASRGSYATVLDHDHSSNPCKVQYWGRCTESDIGWVKYSKIRRAN